MARTRSQEIGGTIVLVTVVRVAFGVDMRKVHTYRRNLNPRLKLRQAVLLINGAKDRARLIDSAGGCHNYYAPEGEQFDVREIERQVKALGLRLSVPGDAARAIDGEEKHARKAA